MNAEYVYKSNGEIRISTAEPEVGDYVDYFYLAARAGKFYTVGDKSYCDTPLMTFILESNSFVKGYRRIE